MMISSFVAPEDVDVLWNILEKIKHNALKNQCLVLYGDGGNGKTVLMNIMQKIATNYGRVPSYMTSSQPLVSEVNKDIVFVEDADDETILGIQEWIHEYIGKTTRLRSFDSVVIRPGLFIIATNKKPDINENLITLALPNHFQHNSISVESLIERDLKNLIYFFVINHAPN